MLKRGIGKVYLIEDSWFEKCIHDEEFLKEAKEMKWNMFNVRITIEKYEEYLKKKGILKKEEKILDEKWAVMTYTGMFLMLNKKEVDAVKKLIGNLVAYQIRNGINRFSYIEE